MIGVSRLLFVVSDRIVRTVEITSGNEEVDRFDNEERIAVTRFTDDSVIGKAREYDPLGT